MAKKDMKTDKCYCYSKRCNDCIHFVTTKGRSASYDTGCKFNRTKPVTLLDKIREALR